MAVSIILFDLFRKKCLSSNQDSNSAENQVLKSCLSSGSKRREIEKIKKTKRVTFAEDVIKDSNLMEFCIKRRETPNACKSV
ncbi:hypothetical protein ACS0TY_012575 [Phlomoides rotata]